MDPHNWQVRYVFSRDMKFVTFDIVAAQNEEYLDPHCAIRDDHLDLSFPRRLQQYDKLGYKLLLRKFRYYFLGSERAPLTKRRCEEFFDNEDNFLQRVQINGPPICPLMLDVADDASIAH